MEEWSIPFRKRAEDVAERDSFWGRLECVMGDLGICFGQLKPRQSKQNGLIYLRIHIWSIFTEVTPSCCSQRY